MRKIFPARLNIYQVLLGLLVLLSLIPIIVLITQSINNLDSVAELSNKNVEVTVKKQTVQLYKVYAENLAQRLSDFLHACELDLEDLTKLAVNPQLYLQFSKDHQRWVNSFQAATPTYREIAFIDKNGAEVIKILDNAILSKNELKNISNPENTTFKTETYFEKTKASHSDLYVSHLQGWYISRQEQLEQGKAFRGVIRFCKKLTDDKGDFAGMYMLALDHRHIMDFIWHAPMDKESLVTTYKTGNYNYIIDDESWIIAHPKNWDIRGLDKNGALIEPLTENTPQWKFDAGLIPINLQNMDWRLHDIYTDEPMSSIINRVQRGETVITTMKSMGIYGESEGIIRTRAYAPIRYDSNPYDKYGIFGAVVIGTSLEEFSANTRILVGEIENINKFTKNRMIVIATAILIGVIFFSFFVAQLMAKPMRKLNQVLNQIGDGNFDVPNIESSIHEIRELSHGVKNLARDLKDKEEKLNQNVKELEIVNMKLAEAKKELDFYWKHEYETESDTVLEEKISFYEKEYAKLKEIRKDIYIGNSPAFLRMLRQIVPLSQMTIPTWICGESGVGKSALARAMHLLSPRCNEPFHVFEAAEFAASDPMIVLGKLFGYGPGHGIQGIDKNGQKGIIEECHRGTLLIDDVDALPLETQAQILRVVDGLTFHPAAGKTRNINSDIRFIFATNVDLEQKLLEGSFRKDLFRRMGGSVNKIEIPPLRDRKSDIPLLANYFIKQASNRFNIDFVITNEALILLASHDYKEGNIAELLMLIELACQNARIEGDSSISENHFPAVTKLEHQVLKKSDSYSEIFSNRECKELGILRRNNFHMKDSEQELGFNRGSRTLSHHLRGVCLKALSTVDWDIDEATKLVAGSLDSKIEKAIKERIKGYIKNIEHKCTSSHEASLYKNLPKEYHSILENAIFHFMKSNQHDFPRRLPT